MDPLDSWLRRAADILSLMLAPWIEVVQRVSVMMHQRMDAWNVPYEWQSPLMTGLVLVEMSLVMRFLSGWIRSIVIAVTILTVLKVYDLA